jgi:hypothetical protein
MLDPFSGGRKPRADESYSVAPFSMYNYQEAISMGVAKQNEALLVFRMQGILDRLREWILECRAASSKDTQ